jgi:REP element-mobilizing transposase RayT
VRLSFELCVYGYVVVPEHVHLLLSQPQQHTLADAIKSLKRSTKTRERPVCPQVSPPGFPEGEGNVEGAGTSRMGEVLAPAECRY